eukprot:CAMPEP_0194286730 /NCGR_PEP_ID=MMETSP0169-20130528/33151_1 /TAXON_ID=218684 /ORGANISM="Corethron pennatum, Strain L29A3" /LENGTH=156 /DNA_ID=CAMNT_0039033241 /DNA_START=1068 /DNA_END=1535 /DNA_ORIENTATION=-
MTKIKPIAESWGDNINNIKSLIYSPCKCNLDDSADLSSLPYYQQKSMKVFTNEVTDDKIPGDDWNSIRNSFQKVAHLPEQEHQPTELEDNDGRMKIINEVTPLSAVGCTKIHDGLFSLVTEFGRDMAMSNLSKLESKISSKFQNFEQKLDNLACGP